MLLVSSTKNSLTLDEPLIYKDVIQYKSPIYIPSQSERITDNDEKTFGTSQQYIQSLKNR